MGYQLSADVHHNACAERRLRLCVSKRRSAFGLGDLVDQCRRKERIELHPRSAAIAGATVDPALIADFDEVGVEDGRGAGGAHASVAAFHVPNEN